MRANPIADRNTCEEAVPSTPQPLPPGVSAGASVHLRGRVWHLDATLSHADCHELHLSQIVEGTQRIVLWPFDRPAPLPPRPAMRVVRPRGWVSSLAGRAAGEIDVLTPRGRGSDVEVVPYQLAPALAMAAGAARILLADEVGLGKTIQAGWIISDLVAREPGARVLLAVPAGLREQWAAEMLGRFALPSAPVDARWLRHAVADLPADVSPWSPPGIYIASLDFLKRPDITSAIEPQVWDLLVIDEAHTATVPTDRFGAMARIAASSRRIVAITATPYSGNPASFVSLSGLGAIPGGDPPLMFRRSRQDVGDPRKRRHRFAAVRLTAAEISLQRGLERYSREVWNAPNVDVDGARLAVTILRKRALSSASAAGHSLRRRLRLLQGQQEPARQLTLFADDEIADDEVAAAALATPGLADAAREHRLLAGLIAAADAAALDESKLRFLQRLSARLSRESIVVFTEYRDTLLRLSAALQPSLQLHGGLTATERSAVQARFNRDGGVLLATDAAAEGLNLQGRGRLIVNYELPWNPARLEQRIGRVDRIGQSRTVHAITLTASDTAEDLVLRNLARRLSRVAAALGSTDRLAALLDDRRMAGIVIGQRHEAAAADEIDTGAALVVRDEGDLTLARQAAARLQTVRRHSQDRSSDILVSSLRARRGSLPAGVITIVVCTARTPDGFVVGRRFVPFYKPGRPAKPSSAEALRRAAEAGQVKDPRPLAPDIDRWFDSVRAEHDAAMRRHITREAGLRERGPDRRPLQPGLFDGRAVAAAERAAIAEHLTEETRATRIAALERARTLQLTFEPSAILVIWR
jgi:superfamily II DNA or RNA helicase